MTLDRELCAFQVCVFVYLRYQTACQPAPGLRWGAPCADLGRPWPQECLAGNEDIKTTGMSSSKRLLRVIKILRILKIMRLLKGIKLIE